MHFGAQSDWQAQKWVRDCISTSSQGGEQGNGWGSKDTVWLGAVEGL